MDFIEITGQSCSGKTKFIEEELILDTKFDVYKINFFTKLYNFLVGIKYLGLERTKVLLSWSLQENASLFFRINVFRNAVLKFGNFKKLSSLTQTNLPTYVVDEGLSHLPFLFLCSNTEEVLNFISEELKRINVELLKSPGHEVIENRLIQRGHKRLKFLSISFFTDRNSEIEDILLRKYPNLCSSIKIIEDVRNIQ